MFKCLDNRFPKNSIFHTLDWIEHVVLSISINLFERKLFQEDISEGEINLHTFKNMLFDDIMKASFKNIWGIPHYMLNTR